MRVIAHRDPELRASVVHAAGLHYAAGADPAIDRPGHVRSGSSLAWVGGRLAIVQDDAAFVAFVDPGDASVAVATLPAGANGVRQFDDGRGNKGDKLDLEALVAAGIGRDAMLVAFGSGSTPLRETIVTLRDVHDPAPGLVGATVAVHEASAVYAGLRRTADFAGAELNVEGAVLFGGPEGARVRLFNRGNGAARGEAASRDATCDLDWDALLAHLADPAGAPAPTPTAVTAYDLGAVGGCRLGFTDAALVHGGAGPTRIIYLAAAEDSPDATRDGPVAGCAVGVIVDDDGTCTARWAPLVDATGAPFTGKVEGIAIDPADPMRLRLVSDRDSPDEPSELCDIRLDGPWYA